MRVVHYLWSADIGGIERLVLDLSHAQQADPGLDVAVLLGTRRGPLLPQYEANGIALDAAGLRGGRDLSFRRLWWLTRYFRRFDVIHLHTFHPLVSMAAARSGRTVLFTEHGTFGLLRPRGFGDRCKRFLKRRFVNRAVDFVTFNSEFTRRTARSLFGLRKVPQAVVLNGTRLRFGTGEKNGVDRAVRQRCREASFVVGTFARFTPRKRIDRLLDAFATWKERSGAILLLVGDGPERERLEALAARHGIEDRVVFAGYQANVAAYAELMDVCAFPAEVEGFGLVAIEAMALGKPAIVFADGGGIAEVVQTCEPKDVVPDVHALARRLTAYREQKAAGTDRPEVRRAHARRFDIDVMAERLGGIYRELVEQW